MAYYPRRTINNPSFQHFQLNAERISLTIERCNEPTNSHLNDVEFYLSWVYLVLFFFEACVWVSRVGFKIKRTVMTLGSDALVSFKLGGELYKKERKQASAKKNSWIC